MNKIKKIVFLTLIMIIIISIIVFLVDYNKNYDFNVSIVKDRNEYFDVLNCANKFFEYSKSFYFNEKIENIDNYIKINENDSYRIVLDFLDDEYKKSYDVKINNLYKKLKCINKSSYIRVTDIKRINKQKNLSLYTLNVDVINKENMEKNKINIAVKKDSINNIFSIYLSDYIDDKKLNDLKENDKIRLVLKSINNKILNLYTKNDMSNYEYVKKLETDLIDSIIYNREFLYNNLDDEFKKEKFESYESFNEYIKKNSKKFILLKTNGFSIENNKDKYIYKFNTTDGSSYIFYEISPMNYKIKILLK